MVADMDLNNLPELDLFTVNDLISTDPLHRQVYEAGVRHGIAGCMNEVSELMNGLDEQFVKDGRWTVPGRFATRLLAAGFARQLAAVGASNYLEVAFDAETPAPFVVIVQRTDGKSPGQMRSEAEARAEAAEAALASLRAVAMRVVALQPGAYSEPTPAELRRFSESVNDLENEAAKVPATAAPVVTLSVDQARLALEAFDMWLTNMQCVDETPAMLAVSDHIRAALDGAPRG